MTKDMIKVDETKAGEFEKKALEMRSKSLAFKVVDEDSKTKAETGIKVIKGMVKAVKEFTEPTIRAAHEAHKTAKAAENKLVHPLDEAERHLKNQLSNYYMKLERDRREKEQEERKRREEELRKAEEAAAAGNEEEADEILEKVIKEEAAPVLVVPEKKTEGVSTRADWKWELVDIDKVPREFMMLDESKVTRYVKAMKKDAKIPGIQIRESISVAVRS